MTSTSHRSILRAFGALLCIAVSITPTAARSAQMTNQQLPVVVVLSTGGTIAGRGGSTMSLSEYKSGSILGSELVDAVPEIKQFADVRVEQISNVGSTNMNIAIWRKLAERINAIYEQDANVAGIVITHGTNTIEETAYFLNLTVKHDRPVVLVGAQRPATALSADGPLNLVNGVRAAAARESRGKGVLVVLNDEINAARDVTKTNTYRAETFKSGELGFLGYVDQDRVAYYRQPIKRHTVNSEFDVKTIKDLPKVEIVYAYAEPANPVVIDALVKHGVRGIVIAGTGAGGMSDAEKDAAKKASASKVVFVRASRVGNGRVIPRKEYDDLGMIAGDNLNPQKARILLMLALSKTSDLKEIRRMFEEY
ncbi:MAG TPA: asparaginase [Burkholderiales bacterium]|nr:asparaginase [Burkholderiales bacterium]